MEEKVRVLDLKKCNNPKQLDIYQIDYIQDDAKYSKEVVKTLDVVKILIYDKSSDSFVITKQFRPLVYVNHPDAAFRYELCGGRCDKDLSTKEIAIEEVLEETGYRVDDLKKITTLYTASKMTLYYAKVDDSMKVESGGGMDYEMIDLLYLPISKAKEFMFDESKPKRPGLMFAFCWFFENVNTNSKN